MKSHPAVDPFGKTIYLSTEICGSTDEGPGQEEVYDDIAAVIEKPALIIEVTKEKESEFYYFRSVGSEKTLLIHVHYHDTRWEAYECEKNPDSNKISALLRKGKQLL